MCDFCVPMANRKWWQMLKTKFSGVTLIQLSYIYIDIANIAIS